MITAYLILLTAVLIWKGYYAWRRALRTYRADRQQHDTLREYLLGNGASNRKSLEPFLQHALHRALHPLLGQWRLFAILLALGLLIVVFCSGKPLTKQPSADLTDLRISHSDATYLRRYAYKCWYSESMRIPLAVSWYLTGSHVSGSFKRKGVAFHPDYDVKGIAVTTTDYIQSGYDRGHMCPSGDNKWHQLAQEQTFLMTNICPQDHQLNTNDWNSLELRCRQWARRYGTIYIVCGPLLRGDKHKTIGRQRQRRITVPEAFYKVVLRLGSNPAAIGFVYENNSQEQPMHKAVRTVDDIERMTGIDFFCQLDDKTERALESHANLSDW